MHYYTKNIADFNNATRHLSRLERSIYSDLLELQYDIETPLPGDIDWICRRILARDEEERTAVQRMLNEFFDSVEQGWSNGRAESEIKAFHKKKSAAVKAGKASGAARRRNKKPSNNKALGTDDEQLLNGRSQSVEPTNNQEPITNNQTIESADKVIDYLNLKAGTAFRHSESSRKPVLARLKEFTVDDCMRVIDNRCDHWLNTDQAQYLRPSTLFRKEKFEGYLNAPSRSESDHGSRGDRESNPRRRIAAATHGAAATEF